MAFVNRRHFGKGLNFPFIAGILKMSKDALFIQGPFTITLLLDAGHPEHHILSESSGVYIVWHQESGRCIYVGMVEKQPAKQRLKQHWKDASNKDFRRWIYDPRKHLDFCFIPCPEGKEEIYEAALINRLQPATNKRLPSVAP